MLLKLLLRGLLTVQRISTGISGLDEILYGGLIPKRAYLVRGGPGTGKTTLGLHFLAAGQQKNKETLFISLVEEEAKIKEDAQIRDFELEGINFLDLSPSSEFVTEREDYDIFPSSEVEQEPLLDAIIERIKELQPDLIFIDSLTQLRHLAPDSFQFRKQILSLVKFSIHQGATMLLCSEASSSYPDDDLQFISDGIINLEIRHDKRFIKINKFRGFDFMSGDHSMVLEQEGVKVFPKLKVTGQQRKIERKTISSGITEIDQLLQGGVEKGTTTIISGPSGVGKTTLGLQFIKEAAKRGTHSIIYTFEEGTQTILTRCKGINMPLDDLIEQGLLTIKEINPLEYTPEQFAQLIQTGVKEDEIEFVMIDSISGYRHSFGSLSNHKERMIRNLHSLSRYLTNIGVTVLLVNEMQNITGDFRITDDKVSYMADNILFLRYLEMQGRMKKAIGILKKRLSDFERTLREFEITNSGIQVGQPLSNLRGVLTGKPEFITTSNQEE